MSKRDYELIARIMRYQQPHEVLKSDRMLWGAIVENFADEFEAGNPRFNRATFLRACGVEVAA